jgi:hypothetical protein
VAHSLATGSDTVHIADSARRQQLLYRRLAHNPNLARRVLAHTDVRVRVAASAHLEAARKLRSLVTPVESATALTIAQPTAPRDLRSLYAEAESRYGVAWYVLAAVNFVESRFGRVLGPSAAGALGPMQFLPATWDAYGEGGDIMDPRDAIVAAARYLKALGADEDVRAALLSYNRSEAYADAVLTYAWEMKADETAFYAYYYWRVIVATPDGDVCLG